jgi:hypothetical protein
MQLTEVEAAVRTLESELAIRPLFHQLEKRVKAIAASILNLKGSRETLTTASAV